MNNELVSIIITTHGRGDRVGRAIDSAVGQTYRNIEVIVVDDNSDNLLERKKTEESVKRYPKIRLIKNRKLLGGAASRNVGVENAKGELISFLDDDDEYLPERVEKLYRLLKEHQNDNVGLVYCSYDAVNEFGKVVGESKGVFNGRPFFQHMMNCVAATSMWLLPKTVLESVGGFDDVPSKQDSTTILEIISAGYNIFGTSEKLVLYLEHQGDRISGAKKSNVDGINMYREKCRNTYGKINKKESALVECNFSNQLIVIFLLKNDIKEAKNELRNIKKNKFLSKIYFKNLMKVSFRGLYLRRLSKIKERRFHA